LNLIANAESGVDEILVSRTRWTLICSYVSLEGLATEYPSCTIRVCTSLIRRVTKTISIDFRVPAATTHFQRYPSFDLRRVLIVLHFCYTFTITLLLGLGFRVYYRFLSCYQFVTKWPKIIIQVG
jgi:hypothetical protein